MVQCDSFSGDLDYLDEPDCCKKDSKMLFFANDADHLDELVCCKGVVQFDIFSPKIWIIQMSRTDHTAPESVKRVKSIAQILVKNKMEVERLSQC